MWLCWLQDSIDLFLGNFAVDETDGPTPLRVQKDWKFLTVGISPQKDLSITTVVNVMTYDGNVFIYVKENTQFKAAGENSKCKNIMEYKLSHILYCF